MQLCRTLLFGLIASSLGDVLPAEPSDPLARPYDEATFSAMPAELPFTYSGTSILLDGVRVNGTGPYRFLLDTAAMGAGRIDVSLATKLGLKPVDTIQAGDGTNRGSVAMPVYRLEELSIGPARFRGVQVLSRDYNEHGAVVRGHIDGVLGFHLFRELLLTVDYPGRAVRIEQGALPEPDGKAVLPLKKDEPVPTVEFSLGGANHAAHIDTGAMGGISVPDSLADSLSFQGEPRTVGEARTLTGSFPIRTATLNGEARIGGHRISEPEVVVGAPMRMVNLGGRVLEEFVLTFDQQNGRVRFERPRKDSTARDAGGERKRYGFMLALAPDGKVEINGTVPGSIAERAGLKPGDRITHINGQSLEQMEPAARDTALRSTPLRLEIERDGKKLELTLSWDD